MIKIETTKLFKRDLKRLLKKHYDLDALKTVIELIIDNDIKTLKQKYDWHPLHGDKNGIYDVHVVSYQDWLLLYTVVAPEHILILATGSHNILKRQNYHLLP